MSGYKLNLSFNAPYVDCTNALDWEIQQVVFDTMNEGADDSEENRDSPYVLISRNFEFPDSASIEWYYGNEYDGGHTIHSAMLQRNQIQINFDDDRIIKILFDLNETRFEELSRYLQNILNGRLKIEPTINACEPRVLGPQR